MENFQAAQHMRKTPSPPVIASRAKKWKPPDASTLKTYWDTALESHANTSGLGGVIRDSDGNVLASFGCRAEHVHNPKVAEALEALQKTMFIFANMEFSSIVFEGECQESGYIGQHKKRFIYRGEVNYR